MTRKDFLIKRQALLKDEILPLLDSFLIGAVNRSPSMTGHNLTTKVAGKTKTLYVRKSIVPKALEFSKRYKKLWRLIQKNSQINWELLNLENN